MERPPSVELGTVVPPEDPEDWRRPLTWQVAAGMLVAPALALIGFWLAPPTSTTTATPLTYVLAATVAVGAAVTGASQRGWLRTALATIGAGLFGALGAVVVATLVAGERAVGVAAPEVALGVAAALAGLGGTLVAASLGGLLADRASRGRRIASPALAGAISAIVFVRLLLPG